MPDPKRGLKQQVIEFFQHEPIWYWTYFKFEMGCLSVFFIAFVVLSKGKSENSKIATNFGKVVIPTFFHEFTNIGCDFSGDKNNRAILQKSYCDFDYFASGRKNSLYCELKLNLVRRHCILTSIFDAFRGNSDRVELHFPLANVGQSTVPIEFLIIQKGLVKRKLKEN